MEQLSKFEFTPAHQPFDTPVAFTLRPLDQRGLYELQASLRDGIPGWSGIEAAARHIVGWSGLPDTFSRARMLQVLAAPADINWTVWLGEITGHLYRKALVPEDAAKKS